MNEPFPYLVLKDALPLDLADQLLAEFPPLGMIAQGASYGSNQRFSYPAHDILSQRSVGALWQEFIAANISREFLDQFVQLFAPAIVASWPDLGTKLASGTASLATRAGDRLRAGIDSADIVLDCQICVNTPVTERPSAVKVAHLDNARELFGGLYYLRSKEDTAPGGDLRLYRYTTSQPRFHGPRLIANRYIEPFATVPYRHNTLVLFINTPNAIHGVTPRAVTDQPRTFVNFVGDVQDPLWDASLPSERLWDRVIRKLLFS